jgi:hypothetical protein
MPTGCAGFTTPAPRLPKCPGANDMTEEQLGGCIFALALIALPLWKYLVYLQAERERAEFRERLRGK